MTTKTLQSLNTRQPPYTPYRPPASLPTKLLFQHHWHARLQPGRRSFLASGRRAGDETGGRFFFLSLHTRESREEEGAGGRIRREGEDKEGTANLLTCRKLREPIQRRT